jgi:exocyst complex component 2
MAEFDKSVLAYYNIQVAGPTEWPAELDGSDDELPDEIGVRRSRSRYSALERSASDRRSGLVGAQKTSDGRSNLVQKDESDPLGMSGSVVSSLRSRGLPVEQDPRLRNKFMLSSTTFSPALFLSQAHHDASTDELVQGLQFLSQSIDQKSASLKVLVETNFERFVRAKATIDNVYTEMRNQGMEPEQARPTTPRHSRNVSRQSGIHYRNFSSGSATNTLQAQPQPTISKNALRKETDYGIQGIRGPLLEVSQKAEEVWGPALGGKEREASLKSLADAVEKERQLYELGSNLRAAIKQRDYEDAVQHYNKARDYANQAKTIAERVSFTGQSLTDDQVQKILVTGRMWSDVEDQVKTLKRDIWRRLSNIQSVLPLPGDSNAEEHMELIGILLELGVDDNPIWVWLLSRYDHLKNKISAVIERSRIEIEILRRRLAAKDGPDVRSVAAYLRQAVKEHPSALDQEQVVEFWETITTYLTKLLSMSSGLLGEVIDFWESAKSFIEGSKQKALPTGFEGESRKHHRLSDAGVKDLTNGAAELAELLRQAVHTMFADPPSDDISALFSPTSATGTAPNTPGAVNAFSPTEGRLGRVDRDNLPAPSPKKGEAWEDFSFWAPHSNSLSATQYISKLLAMVTHAAEELASMSTVAQNSQATEKLRTTVATARERSLRALCEAWSKDSESCNGLEDWTRAPEKRDQTKLPLYFEGFEKKILTGVQQVLYLAGSAKQGSQSIVTPPPSKLLQVVRTQFVNSIYKAVSAMLENAQRDNMDDEDDWVLDSTTAKDDDVALIEPVRISNRNVRLLLTLSNLKALKNDYVPSLVTFFESSFSVTLTDEPKTIRDVFGQIDAKLFKSYTQPTVERLTRTVKEGINSPDWAPVSGKPDQVRPYVYSAMMILVMVHTEVSTTVATIGNSNALLNEILSYLLEKVSQALLDSFKERKPNMYTLPALIQATLDTEFIAQTMSQYSTTKAGEIQGQIYMELDKRSDNNARAKLQQELGDMRGVLKRLREQSRNSFGCFKRPRSDKDGRSRADRGNPAAA